MPTHAEQKLLPHSPEQMFDLVADVASYPKFLPWCIATRIKSESDTELLADMVIGFKVFREQYTSLVKLDRPRLIDVEYQNGPFKYLENHWKFEPAGEGSCLVDFHVDFEFRSIILEKAIGRVFTEAVHRMVGAFETRADEIYR